MGQPDRKDLQEFCLQGWPGSYFQPESSGRHCLRTGFPQGSRFCLFCFSLKPSGLGPSVHMVHMNPFAQGCVQACLFLVQGGHQGEDKQRVNPACLPPAQVSWTLCCPARWLLRTIKEGLFIQCCSILV